MHWGFGEKNKSGILATDVSSRQILSCTHTHTKVEERFLESNPVVWDILECAQPFIKLQSTSSLLPFLVDLPSS